jgi:hypothetical protein
MERWLNEEIQQLVNGTGGADLLNPFSSTGHVPKSERNKRLAFRTAKARRKIMAIVAEVTHQLGRTKR